MSRIITFLISLGLFISLWEVAGLDYSMTSFKFWIICFVVSGIETIGYVDGRLAERKILEKNRG